MTGLPPVPMWRRAADREKTRLNKFLLWLCLALSVLSSCVGYKAIRACDGIEASNEAAFQLGQALGRMQPPPRNQQPFVNPMDPEAGPQ